MHENNFPAVNADAGEIPQAAKTELTSAQERYARGLFAVSGTQTLEEARKADWRFDGQYYAPERGAATTNYQVTENEEQREVLPDDTARRCTICHQPLDYVNLIAIKGQVVQMGRDCAAKLQRFIETGQIIAENPAREIWDEQSAILLEGGAYEKDILAKPDDELKKRDYAAWRKSRVVSKRRISLLC